LDGSSAREGGAIGVVGRSDALAYAGLADSYSGLSPSPEVRYGKLRDRLVTCVRGAQMGTSKCEVSHAGAGAVGPLTDGHGRRLVSIRDRAAMDANILALATGEAVGYDPLAKPTATLQPDEVSIGDLMDPYSGVDIKKLATGKQRVHFPGTQPPAAQAE
jgi:hypothetical protein